MSKRTFCMLSLSLVVTLAVAGFALIQNQIRYGMSTVDSVGVLLLDNTKWASGYSDSKFKSIEVGMSTEQVHTILGDCLFEGRNIDGEKLWHYTIGQDGKVMSNSRHSTHLRIIHFDDKGKVRSKTYSYYFD